MRNPGYLLRRLLSAWKRTRLVSDFLARRLLFRFLGAVPVLAAQDNVTAKPLALSSDARVLVLAPHSDDESIGCGGLLLTHAAQCEVVCLTDGRHGDPSMSPHELIALRETELADAMAVAGVQNFRFLGVPDQLLIDGYDRFSSLAIGHVDMIFLPNFLDQHPDHKAVTWLLQRLLREKKTKPTLKIAFYEIWGTLPVWNAYTDLDAGRMARKRQMIDCFASQTRQIDYGERIAGLHTYRGIAVGRPAVEAYLVLDVDSFLALP